MGRKILQNSVTGKTGGPRLGWNRRRGAEQQGLARGVFGRATGRSDQSSVATLPHFVARSGAGPEESRRIALSFANRWERSDEFANSGIQRLR